MIMSQRRGTTTNRLSNVVQVIQLGQKTGILTAERGEGAALETGEITFVRGQITNARCGPLNGHAAWNKLNSWGACRFFFVYYGTENATGSLPALPPPMSPSVDEANVYRRPGTQPLSGSGFVGSPSTGSLQQPDSSTDIPYIRPYRIMQAEKAIRLMEQAGVSRLHRHLFLLQN
jgi:hypothetical protein